LIAFMKTNIPTLSLPVLKLPILKLLIATVYTFVCLAVPVSMAAERVSPKKSSAKKVTQLKPKAVKLAAKQQVDVLLVRGTPRTQLVRRVVAVNGKRKAVYQRVAAVPMREVPTVGDLAGLHRTPDPLELKSNVAYVMDQSNKEVLFEKNANVALPIASLTKLMTSLVVLEANQNMDEMLTITDDDVDREKFSSSRLKVNTQLPRSTMLHLALMSSENRAASALGRYYPGGLPAFVTAMNAKAKALGMEDTHYVDANGLSSKNVASGRDLAKLVVSAYQHPLIRQYSTDPKFEVAAGRSTLHFANTNQLVSNPDWDIGLQKTGYISEAGRCLVMQTKIEGRSVVMVFLDSKGKQSRLGDANRIRKWLEVFKDRALTIARPGMAG
jgi:serine-type D-Ala-D-Ala endopeptidase (penicillin-binding protein 7)